MEKLPPIPSPPGTLFREFRITALPVLAFLLILALSIVTWRSYVVPAVLVGEVEAIRRVILSPQPGRLTAYYVDHLQRVEAGDPLVEVLPSDPRLLEARLAVTRARLSFVQDAVDARVRQQNNRTSLLQLRLDWLNQRALLASLRAQETYYRLELERQEKLLGGGVTNRIASETPVNPNLDSTPGPEVTDHGQGRLDLSASARSENYADPRLASSLRPDEGLSLQRYFVGSSRPSRLNSIAEYDVAVRDHRAVTGEITERERLVNEVETAMAAIGDAVGELDVAIPDNLRRIVEVEEQELRAMELQLRPQVLVAPSAGVVSFVHRREGENIVDGEPILTLSAISSDRIIAYLRQPLTLEPHTNMVVEVRSRSLHREVGEGRILAVGTQMEPILPQLLPGATGSNTVEYGLPILVSLPPGMRVHPGEVVDLLPRAN